jgi:glycosyltransferase involved in cell wall biosynthesis
MRVLVVIPSFYPAIIYGGPIFSTLNNCKELARLEDMNVYVSSTNADMNSRLNVEVNRYIELETRFKVKYYNETIIGKFSLDFFLNILKDIKKSDVIHIQSLFSTTTITSLFYARIFQKPILLSPRGQLGGWSIKSGSSFKQLWLRLFIKPFSKYVVWHATAAHEKKDIFKIFPQAKVQVISNGIEYGMFQKFTALTRQEFLRKYVDIEVDVDKIIISLGRLQKVKGFDILIASFDKILSKHPNSKLLIAGQDEGEEGNLKKQIAKLNLLNKVFLVGSISGKDKIDFLANADLFALPSHNENFGNVYLESLAAGTPIIASKNTPWKNIVTANCGKWVENTVEETSKAMLEILEKDRILMRKNSIKLAGNYNWPIVAMQFKKLFISMVNDE